VLELYSDCQFAGEVPGFASRGRRFWPVEFLPGMELLSSPLLIKHNAP
jgi:hypothetical protein